LPAHEHDQAKAEEQKEQAHEKVLDTNDFMVCGKNVFAQEGLLV
jgi:hypothetical protein